MQGTLSKYFNSDGLLPEGIHECSIDQIEESFGRFTTSDRRPMLFSNLKIYWNELRKTNFIDHMIVNGSFVTDKKEPGDIDLIVVIKKGWQINENWNPYDFNLVSAKRIKQIYKLDAMITWVGSKNYDIYIEGFRQVTGQPHLRKGIIRLTP